MCNKFACFSDGVQGIGLLVTQGLKDDLYAVVLRPFTPLREMCSDLLHGVSVTVVWRADPRPTASEDDDTDADLFSPLESGFHVSFQALGVDRLSWSRDQSHIGKKQSVSDFAWDRVLTRFLPEFLKFLLWTLWE